MQLDTRLVLEKTHLAPELFVSRGITIMAKSLFQESQENGDNNASLQCLTEADEED